MIEIWALKDQAFVSESVLLEDKMAYTCAGGFAPPDDFWPTSSAMVANYDAALEGGA